MSGSGISWAICKSAPCSRQITTPAPHYSLLIDCPSETQIVHNSWLYFDMFVFHNWPFPHVYFAKNVANSIFHFNSWLSFQRLYHFLWGYHFHFVHSNRGSNDSVMSVPSWHVLILICKTSATAMFRPTERLSVSIFNIWKCWGCLFQVASH